jgi:hypothetical protein
MNDYYLKFADEAAANAVLFASTAEQLDEQGNVVVRASEAPNYVNVSVIGIMYEKPPLEAPEGYMPVALEGWHVNVRAEASPELEPFQVFPLAPMRVWA